MSNRLISQTQSDRLRAQAANSQLRAQLVEEFGSNIVDVYVLTAPELARLWVNRQSVASAVMRD